MPILKTEILGSLIEINFDENERDKLLRLINNFKQRLSEFPIKNGKIHKNTIMFLAALKAEDNLDELKSLVCKLEEDRKIITKQKNIIEKLSKEIVFLKDKASKLSTMSLSEENNNSHANEEIIKLENILHKIQQKILSKNNDRY